MIKVSILCPLGPIAFVRIFIAYTVWLEVDALYPFESQGLGERFHSSIDDLGESIWIAMPMPSSKMLGQVICDRTSI